MTSETMTQVPPHTATRVRFVPVAILWFVLLVLVQNWPVLLMQVPLPMDIVFSFPAWGIDSRPELATRHAELGDLITEFYPWRSFTARAVQHRVFPLWNPYSFLGTPFQATPSNALFYPLTVLYYLLPTTVAWTLNWLLRPLLAGLFASWFGRTIGMTRSGALLAGVGYAFSSFMVVWQGWPHADSALWLPLVFVAVEKLGVAPSLKRALGLAAACSLTFLGGHPGVALYAVIAAMLFALYRILLPEVRQERFKRGRVVLLIVVAGMITIALTAVQLLPMLEWVQHTYRSPDFNRAWSLNGEDAVGFFCRDIRRVVNYAGLRVPEHATYAGIVTLVLAFLAFMGERRRMSGFFLLLTLFALSIIFGWGPGYWLSSRTPALKAFNNIRFIVLTCFSVSVLAGIGLSALQERRAMHGRQWPWWISWAAGGIVCGAGIAALRVTSDEAGLRDAEWSDRPWVSALLLVVTMILCSPPVARRWRFVAVAILLLGAADLLTISHERVPFYPASRVFPEPAVYRLLKQRDSSLYRVLTIDVSFPSNAELSYGLFSATGYEYPLARTHRILDVFADGNVSPSTSAKQLLQDRTRLLDLMNVKYVLGNRFSRSEEVLSADPARFRTVIDRDNIIVIENLHALPRAFLLPAEAAVIAASPDDAFKRIIDPTFDPTRQAVVETGGRRLELPAIRTGAAEERLVIRSGINTVRIEAAIPRPSLLIVNDAYYPGWRVFVDGERRELLRANYAFRGVFVEAGEHTIEFRYMPASFVAGAGVSAGALLVIAIGAGWARLRRSRPLRAHRADDGASLP
jgi:hypothetical protein